MNKETCWNCEGDGTICTWTSHLDWDEADCPICEGCGEVYKCPDCSTAVNGDCMSCCRGWIPVAWDGYPVAI